MAAAVMQPDGPDGIVDKWAALTTLTQVADRFGLNHRSLGVLRALMTFLPERTLIARPLSAVVFPSNRTLSDRLSGMPESTLRRHLATLVAAGIVSRHDSANRKRFARRAGQGTRIAFGFDLSPLARLWARLQHDAQAAREEAETCAALRAEIATLRVSVGPDLSEMARRMLRRKLDRGALEALKERLEEVTETEKTSGSDSENERHIQTELKSNPEERVVVKGQGTQPDLKALADIVECCKEYKSYFPTAGGDWPSLSRVAEALVPMMGIERAVYADAIARIGAAPAITLVLCMLERLGELRNPGGYLRHMARRGVWGPQDLQNLRKMAGTRKNCQLTI